MRRARVLIFLLGFCAPLWMLRHVPAQDVREPQVSKPKFTVSPETTFVTGPLRSDGSVDFAAAINTRLSKGVTRENNACVLLYQAFGPAPGGTSLSPAFFDALNMEPPPVHGKYLLALGSTISDPQLNRRQQERLNQQQGDAMSRPWTRAEFPEIVDWVERNSEPLRFITAATQREKYYAPLIVDAEDFAGQIPLIAVLLPCLQEARTSARLLCTRAMLHLGEGRSEAAWNDLLTCHRLGRLIGTGPTGIDGLVGYAIDGMTIDADISFIRRTHPTAAQAGRYRQSLKALPALSTISDKVDLVERCVCLDALMVMAWKREDAMELLGVEDGLAAMARVVNVFGLNSAGWDPTLRTSNAWYDRMVKSLRLPTYSERRTTLDRLQQDLKAIAAKMKNSRELLNLNPSDTDRDAAIGRTIGDLIAALLLPSFDAARTAEDRLRQRLDHLDVALALAAFHADHARYPNDLKELKPAYLTQIPLDLFSGKALVYRPQTAGYLLYSVGENARDDNGRTFDDTPAGDDLPVRMTAE